MTTLVSGYDAFSSEVISSNTSFSLHSHLFDPSLQTFLSSILMSMVYRRGGVHVVGENDVIITPYLHHIYTIFTS